MSSSIKTNQLQCFIDREKFAIFYDVYYLETIDKYIKRGAYILDVAGLDNDIKSIKFESGNPNLNIMGILLIMVDYRTNYANEITDVLYQVSKICLPM